VNVVLVKLYHINCMGFSFLRHSVGLRSIVKLSRDWRALRSTQPTTVRYTVKERRQPPSSQTHRSNRYN